MSSQISVALVPKVSATASITACTRGALSEAPPSSSREVGAPGDPLDSTDELGQCNRPRCRAGWRIGR